jgi:integrase/recombinase XerD
MESTTCVQEVSNLSGNEPLFVTSGREGFSANLMTQHFFGCLRKRALRVLASLAGHRNISETQKYIDVNDDMKRNAVELV